MRASARGSLLHVVAPRTALLPEALRVSRALAYSAAWMMHVMISEHIRASRF
jgi:hypothetical protein